MTWYFDPEGSTMDVYDHTGTLVAESRAFNGVWSDVPDEVLVVMDEEAVAAFQAGDNQYVLQTLRHAAFELVEEGTP
jgi:hypothetical protein